MKLSNAAVYFDDTSVYDGYTGKYLWCAQFSSFNDSNAIGSTSTRRILSIAPDLNLPARRVVKIFDDRWLVGDGNPDSWRNKPIRQSFNMRKVTDAAQILTGAQACLNTATSTVYIHKSYFKDTVNNLTEGDYNVFWNIYVSPSETVVAGNFIRTATSLYRAREVYLPVEDLKIVECDELPCSAPVTAVFSTGAYNAINDTYGSGTSSVPIILFDFPQHYNYAVASSPKEQAGDYTFIVAKTSITPEVGKVVTINSIAWNIQAVVDDGSTWLCHISRN